MRSRGSSIITVSSFLVLSSLPCLLNATSTEHDMANLENMLHQQQQQVSHQAQVLDDQKHLIDQLSHTLDNLSFASDAAHAKVIPVTETTVKMTNKKKNQNPQARSDSDFENNVIAIPDKQIVISDKRSSFNLSGQISAIALYGSNGAPSSIQNKFYVGTNTISNSRFTFDTALKISDDVTLGSTIQLGLKKYSSVNFGSIDAAPTIDIRKAEVHFTSPRYGKLMFGQGATASYETAFTDLSGSILAGRSGTNDIGGGFHFYKDAMTREELDEGLTVNETVSALDGLSRLPRIRYDTPVWNGFNLAASVGYDPNRNNKGGDQNVEDIALKFDRKFDNGYHLAFQVSYSSTLDITSYSASNLNYEAEGIGYDGNDFDGSLSILAPNGLSLTMAAGEFFVVDDEDRTSPYYFYFKPGYQWTWADVGLAAVSVDYGRFFYFGNNGESVTAIGVQALQNIEKWDSAVYIGYLHYDLEGNGYGGKIVEKSKKEDYKPGYKDINMIYFGMLYKF